MKTKMNRLLSIMLACVMVFTLLPALTALADDVYSVAEGYCGAEGDGTNLTWTLNSEGLLTVSGTGEMADYARTEDDGQTVAPWRSRGDQIETVVIDAGVVNVGNYAFRETAVQHVEIRSGAERIGDKAFNDCSALKTVFIPETVTEITERYPFQYNTSLEAITVAPGNPVFASDGAGALYNKTDGTLLKYPSANPAGYYETPEGVLVLSNWAFYGAPNLCSVRVSEGVEVIYASVFYECASLTSVTIPATISRGGLTDVFKNCPLTDLYYTGTPRSWCNISESDDVCYGAEVHYINLDEGSFAGKDGAVLQWGFNGLNTLTISGNGAAPDFENASETPWSAYNDLLTAVVLDNGVTGLGANTFAGCSALTGLTVSESVESIGENAFADCSSFATVFCRGSEEAWNAVVLGEGNGALENAVKHYNGEIDGNTNWKYFEDRTLQIYGNPYGSSVAPYIKYCREVLRVEIYRANTITSDAFLYWPRIKTVICSSASTIGPYAFQGCYRLENFVLPSNLKKIGRQAFVNCRLLTGIVLPDGLKEIGDQAFYSCASLTEIELPDSVTKMGSNVFHDCVGIQRVKLGSGMNYVADGAFCGCKSLSQVTLQENLVTLGTGAFCGTAIEHIDIPETVTAIGDGAFKECFSLAEITIPEGVTSIGDYAFWDCKLLESVDIPDGVQRLGYYAFSGCSGLRTVKLPAALTEIDDCAFSLCSSLESLEIPEGVTRIGKQVFKYCRGLKEISLPSTLTEIGSEAFRFSGLLSVSIPEGVTAIGAEAFDNCNALQEISLPSTLTGISDGMFDHCGSLRSVEISEGLTAIGAGAFYGCAALKEIRLPSTLTEIGNGAFESAGLLSVVIPEGVTSIGADVFKRAEQLAAVTLPVSLARFDMTAVAKAGYYDSVELGDVYYNGSVAQWNEIEFLNAAQTPPFGNAVIHYLHVGFDHEAGEPQMINEIPPTCSTTGSYDEVYYCTLCGEAINTNHIVTDPNGHTPGETVTENVIAATCTEAGGYDEVVYCAVCPAEISRTHVTVNANGHTPGSAVTENSIPATCTANGGYDTVVYCVNCPAELSRTHTEIPAAGHSWGEWVVVKQATAEEEGLMRRTCANDPGHVEEEVIPKLQPNTNTFQQFIQRIRDFFSNIVNWFSRLFSF